MQFAGSLPSGGTGRCILQETLPPEGLVATFCGKLSPRRDMSMHFAGSFPSGGTGSCNLREVFMCPKSLQMRCGDEFVCVY